MDSRFEVVVHHQSKFTGLTNLDHYGCENVWVVDEDFWSYFAIIWKIKVMGYPMIESLRYDNGIRRMKNIVKNYDRVHLYVTHTVCKPNIVAPRSLN